MEISTNKKVLISAQKQEMTSLMGALEDLKEDYRKDIEHYRRLAKMKAYKQAIDRERRRRADDVGVWEHVNAVVERIHLFCWRKAVVSACAVKYQKKRKALEEEVFHHKMQHRKERIMVRYGDSWESNGNVSKVS